MEIERKFLIDLEAARVEIERHAIRIDRIKQFYLIDGAAELRIRTIRQIMPVPDASPSATITAKGPRKGASRPEAETCLDHSAAKAILAIIPSKGVAKTRIKLQATNGLIWEIDLYENADGDKLAVAEIEVPSEDFDLGALPAWIAEEVTGDPAYDNKAIAAGGRFAPKTD